MSYLDDYHDEESRSKIPYDDIPISRTYEGSSSRRRRSFNFSGYRILIIMVAVLFVSNIALCIALVHHVKTGKIKSINYYYNEYAATEETQSTLAINNAKWSTVCVAAGGVCNNEYTFYHTTLAHGAGVIYRVTNDTIYFITCYHVVNGYSTDEIWVMLPSQLKPIKVELVHYSSTYDIAVLKYRTSNPNDILDGAKPIDIYDSSYVSQGEVAYAVGNPLSGGFTISKGTISQVNAVVNVEGAMRRELQIDVPINAGNSGGGLFNAKGKFIGLVNAKLNSVNSGKLDVDGIAFAIPGNLVLSIAESIIKNHSKATYINLGVEFIHSEKMGASQVYVNHDGELKSIDRYYVQVSSVSKGIAYGKLHSGDIIEAVEFETEIGGVKQTVKVDMYNKYIFEDYSFAIIENSEMKFYIQGEDSPVVVVASATKTVSGD